LLLIRSPLDAEGRESLSDSQLKHIYEFRP
jgi:hypothetical protein